MNRLKERLLQVFIVTIPLIHSGVKPDRIIQEDYFKYLGMCLVSFFTGSIWLSLFMCLNVFLFIYHGEQVGLAQVLNVFIGLCLFIASKAFFTHNTIESLKKPLLILVLINISWMVLQMMHLDPLFRSQDASGIINDNHVQAVGFFGIKMANGAFLTIVSVFMMASPVLVVLMAVPIIISQSSSVFMAYGAWICFWSYFKFRRFFYLTLLVMGIAGAAYFTIDNMMDSRTLASRFPVWHSCIQKSVQYPIGYGPDSYRKLHKHKNFLFGGDGHYNHAIITPTGSDSQTFEFYSPTNDVAHIEKLTKEANDNGSLNGGQINHWDNPHNGILNLFFYYSII